jgi:hypothetical protein
MLLTTDKYFKIFKHCNLHVFPYMQNYMYCFYMGMNPLYCESSSATKNDTLYRKAQRWSNDQNMQCSNISININYKTL